MTHPDTNQSGINDSFKTAIDAYFRTMDDDDIAIADRPALARQLLSSASTFDEACAAWETMRESQPSIALPELFDEFFDKAGALMRKQEELWILINLQSHCSGGNYELRAFELFLLNTESMDDILDLYRLVINNSITDCKETFLKAEPILALFFKKVRELQALEESEK